MEGCAATWVGWEVTIGVTIHNGMSNLSPNGVGNEHLRRDLWEIFWKVFFQESIDGPKLGGMIEFEFKRCYKTQRDSQQTTLGHLRLEHLNRAQSVESWVIIELLSLRKTTYSVERMTTTKVGLGIEERITGKAV